MTKETMNIHQALIELKLIDKKISKMLNESIFVTYFKGHEDTAEKRKEFENEAKATYQSVSDQIKRRDAIRRAVILSNANTTINIDGKQYTVAEAIELKQNGIFYRKRLLEELADDKRDADNKVARYSGEFLEVKAEEYVRNLLKSMSDSSNITPEMISSIREEYMKNNSYMVIDPIGADAEIRKLNEYVMNFEAGIDSALSTSNAVTLIEIEY